MNINRNNYEEFFMLYADNELDAAEKVQVEEFLTANPDLKTELEMFRQVKPDADATLVFAGKSSLLKQETLDTAITTGNYESYFVLYGDDELSNDEKAAVETFVYRNPSVQAEFELMQKARVSADSLIVFENKQALYRYEKDDKVVPFRWWRIAAAAAVVLFVSGLFWINNGKDDAGQRVTANNKPVPRAKQPALPVAGKTRLEKAGDSLHHTMPILAATDQQQKDNHAGKTTRLAQPAVAVAAGKIKNKSSNIPDQQNVIPADAVAKITDKTMESTSIDPIKHKPAVADIKRPLIAVAQKPMIDQPAIILNPDENKMQVEYASLNNDNVEVLNTTVNTKNALRGFLRKASRLIAKKTNSGDEDGDRKGILIGGFEIAVR